MLNDFRMNTTNTSFMVRSFKCKFASNLHIISFRVENHFQLFIFENHNFIIANAVNIEYTFFINFNDNQTISLDIGSH